MTGIKCCKDCIAPKRYPGCHGVCEEYLTEKAKYEADKKMIRDNRENIEITNYDFDKIACTKRHKRRNRK